MELICKSGGETIWFAWNCWDAGSSFETALAAILSSVALYWLKYAWESGFDSWDCAHHQIKGVTKPPNLRCQIKSKFPLYALSTSVTAVWCLLKGWKGLGAESEPQTDLRFLVEKFCGTRWTAFHWQLDRSQRNLDLGQLTSPKIGIQHPRIVVQQYQSFWFFLN